MARFFLHLGLLINLLAIFSRSGKIKKIFTLRRCVRRKSLTKRIKEKILCRKK